MEKYRKELDDDIKRSLAIQKRLTLAKSTTNLTQEMKDKVMGDGKKKDEDAHPPFFLAILFPTS